MNKWDLRFLDLAGHISQWSKDPSTKVGCVIADKKNLIISVGFNGAPRGVGDVFTGRDQKLRRTIHAEKNALAFAQRSVEGCTAYVTHPTCAQCAAYLLQHGISRVVFREADSGFMERWWTDYEEALDMYLEAEVPVVVINSDGSALHIFKGETEE